MKNKKVMFSRTLKNKMLPYLLLAPCVSLILAILLFPIIQGIRLSFYRINTFAYMVKKPTFVGLDNYKEMFLSLQFWQSLKVTLIFAFGATVGTYMLGLGTALLVNLKFKGRAFIRSSLIVPWAIPPVTLALLWTWIYDPQFGVLNYFLKSTGLIKQSVSLLTDPNLSLYAIIMAMVWRSFPFALMALLSGLQAIPPEHYEAASLDGANAFQKFWYITFPKLKYVSKVVIVLMTIWNTGHFTVIWLTTAGGPVRSSETLVIKAYLLMFRYYKMGRSCTIVTFLFLLSFLLTTVYFLAMGMTKLAEEG